MSENIIKWIAVDWGTTHLRCWAMSQNGEICDQVQSSQGMAVIAAAKSDFESVLVELIEPWLEKGKTLPVVACGMVGARNGWVEVPYDPAPCPPRTTRTRVMTRCREIDFSIYSGVKQTLPADVMRGEETQLSGLLAREPGFEGVVCLPGTHSKWVTIKGGLIQKFGTYMTGEVFGLIAGQSVLRHTLAAEGWDEAAFVTGVKMGVNTPGDFLKQCFSLRAEALLKGLDGVAARSRLSGLLIGQELSGLSDINLVTLIGAPQMVKLYQTALSAIEMPCLVCDSEKMTLAGLGTGLEQVTL
jgi:2-dehydro-3-deoxygalactonokinase